MNKLLLLLCITIVIGSCATAKSVYTPDGQQGYVIDCSGGALNWGMCYEKAGEICGKKGYEVLEKTGDQGTMISGTQFGLFGGSVISRTLIIRCKQIADHNYATLLN